MGVTIPTQECEYLATRIHNGEKGILLMDDLLEVARDIWVLFSRESNGAINYPRLRMFESVLDEINRYFKEGRRPPLVKDVPLYKKGTFYKDKEPKDVTTG